MQTHPTLHLLNTPVQAETLRVVIQVKTLQLERDQCQMLLSSIQQRHKQDMELLENTHE